MAGDKKLDVEGKPGIQRRDALISATLGAGVAVVAGFQADAAPPQDRLADLLIIGAGTAGMTAAIWAADMGAKVIVLEKNPAIGGELHASGGTISASQTKLQMAKMIDDNPALHYRDAMRLGEFGQDPDLLRACVNNAGSLVDWLQELGVQFTPNSPELVDIYPWGTARTHWPIDNGQGVFRSLNPQFQKRIVRGDIVLRTERRVDALIKDANGKVVGATCQGGSGAKERYLAKAVILSTGGYAYNKALLRKYHPGAASAVTGALPHTTGDGIVFAQQAGAKLINMDMVLPMGLAIEDPAQPGTSWGAIKGVSGAILVNKRGERYAAEDDANHSSPSEKRNALARQPDTTVFLVFDEATRKTAAPIIMRPERYDAVTHENYAPEPGELDAQIARGVIVKKADSLGALAAMFGVDGAGLARTVDIYNASVDAGADAQFGRKTKLMTIRQSPFYAIRLVGSFLTTVGGVCVNGDSQVVDVDGKVMPGLYAAGEVIGTGRLMGKGAVSGLSFGAALIFGRLVAENAYQYARTQG